jgi:PAS domain S-box-containing protein
MKKGFYRFIKYWKSVSSSSPEFPNRNIEPNMTKPLIPSKLGGETADLYNRIDWASTSLGDYSVWSEPLKYLVNTMLSCPIPMYICWGEERVFLYNDAYSVLLSQKHPKALGQRFDLVWPEVWPELKDLFLSVSAGANFYSEDMAMTLERNGFKEECYFTFSFNPVSDGLGKIMGLQCICYETTSKILSDRSIADLHQKNESARFEAEKASLELESFFKQAPVAIALLEGPEHRFTLSNELYDKLIGVRSIIGRTVRDVFPDLEGQPFFEILDQVYSTGVAFTASDAPIVLENKSGKKENRFLDFIYAPRLDADGQAQGITATVVDVTAKYLARKALEDNLVELKALTGQLTLAQSDLDEEKRKFEIIFESAASGMAMVKEPQHFFEKANPSFREMLGNRVLIGKSLEEIFPEFKGSNFLAMLDLVYESGNPYSSYEEKIVLRPDLNGPVDRRYFDITFTQLKNLNNRVEGVLIDLIDVTERVRARRKLESSEEQLQLATKAARIGIWDLNSKDNSIVFSDISAQIYGFQTKNPTYEETFAQIHPDDREAVAAAIASAKNPQGNGAYECTHRLIHADGSVRWISAFGQARSSSSISGKYQRLTGAMIDITKEVASQNEIKQAREAADNANSAKSAFLANMSHEIRSPLGAIMGFVGLLKDEQISPVETQEYLGVIERNSHQLLRIIDDILDLSKVEAGKMLVEQIDFSLLEVLADFSSLMGFRARENGIDFSLRADTALPDPIISDPTRLRQILTNIVGNAIKFTKKGLVELIVSYESNLLRFLVKDSGVGISTEESGRIFQAFGQADISTTRKFGGTGLGLVLTKRLSQALGGDFWLESSQVGIGSIFIAEIRIDTPSDFSFIQGSRFKFSTKPVVSQQEENTLLNGKTILVVEDSPDNQMLLRVLLTRYGAKVEIAEDGLMGVEKAMTSKFDIVLMDVQMPRMDGYEAVQFLRSKNYAVPIVALTAHAMIEEREKCLSVGYSDFLSKPIDRTKLLGLLKIILNID